MAEDKRAPAEVTVRIYKGRGFQHKKHGDDVAAYVKIEIGDTKFKTETCARSTTPMWNEECILKIKDKDYFNELHIRVKEKDKDALGNLVIPVSELPPKSRGQRWSPLSEKGKPDGQKVGELCCDYFVSKYSDTLVSAIPEKSKSRTPSMMSKKGKDKDKGDGDNISITSTATTADYHKTNKVADTISKVFHSPSSKKKHDEDGNTVAGDADAKSISSKHPAKDDDDDDKDHGKKSSKFGLKLPGFHKDKHKHDDVTAPPSSVSQAVDQKVDRDQSDEIESNGSAAGDGPAIVVTKPASETSTEKSKPYSATLGLNKPGAATATATAADSSGDRISRVAPVAPSAPEKKDRNVRPEVTSLNPATGPETGGTRVMISGSHLGENMKDISKVNIGGTDVTSSVEWESPEVIYCTTPSGSGSVHVSVKTNSGGKSLNGVKYTYEPVVDNVKRTRLGSTKKPTAPDIKFAPTALIKPELRPEISGISPSSCSEDGEETLVIRGTNLGSSGPDIMELRVAGVDCKDNIVSVTPQTIKVVVGPGRGSGPVVLSTYKGGTAKSAVEFSYVPAKRESGSVSPNTARKGNPGSAVDDISLMSKQTLISEYRALKEQYEALDRDSVEMKDYIDVLLAVLLDTDPMALEKVSKLRKTAPSHRH